MVEDNSLAGCDAQFDASDADSVNAGASKALDGVGCDRPEGLKIFSFRRDMTGSSRVEDEGGFFQVRHRYSHGCICRGGCVHL